MNLSIENGTAMIGGRLVRANIGIEEGRIARITDKPCKGEKIDASGKIILPGLIDIHVHLREPGLEGKEDISTGTKAAAAGGVTTIFEMPNTSPATTTVRLLEEKRSLMREKAVVNYGLYIGATEDNIGEIKKAENVAGVKLYMGSSTGDLLVTGEEAIRNIFNSGKKAVIHAEDEEMMKKNAEAHREESDPHVHSMIRDDSVEASAVRRAAEIASSPEKLHFTHVSSRKGIDLIKKAGSTCDVTPHHLFLTEEALRKQGNLAKMNPALKSSDDASALWEGVMSGAVSCIATDHAGHTMEEKSSGYWDAPSGVPGLETMLPLLLDAVNRNKLSLEQLARLTSESPARIFGARNKGRIEEGCDADVVIVDMNKEKEVRNGELFTKCGWSPFNGWKLKGWPVTTIVNGKVAFENGAVNGIKGTEVEFE